jgi:signal transduction histidine kinase
MRDFVAIASHDLRSPIAAIIGFTSLLTESWDRLDEDQRQEFVAVIGRQAHTLNALVDDLLTSSAIEAGALDTHREALPLRELLATTIADLATRSIDVRVDLNGDPIVLANPEHLRRMVVNLVENGVKYGREPLTIVVTARDGSVEIRVCDVGDGVPATFVDRLFTRFARDDSSGTRRAVGTGLGLSIVRGLAKANDGDAWYEPNEPHGARFCISVPVAQRS